jgi:hypothetical protein
LFECGRKRAGIGGDEMVENYSAKHLSPRWFCNVGLLPIKGGFAHGLQGAAIILRADWSILAQFPACRSLARDRHALFAMHREGNVRREDKG